VVCSRLVRRWIRRFRSLRAWQEVLPDPQRGVCRSDGIPACCDGPPAALVVGREVTVMSRITAMLTMLALGAAAPAAMASSSPTYDHRPGAQPVHVSPTRNLRVPDRVERTPPRVERVPARVERVDRSGRFDRAGQLHRAEPVYHAWDRRSVDDFGPRRYRPTWVALSGPVQLDRTGQSCIEVGDGGTFTQLRLQTAGGIAQIDRVIVQFADGTDQIATTHRVLDDRDELLEIPLDGNNRRIDRVTVIGSTGASSALEVFAI
jgi:hypothetical protein